MSNDCNQQPEPRKCIKCGAKEGDLIFKYRNKDGNDIFRRVWIQKHHWHGYIGDNVFETVDYCRSCDQKAHNLARRNGSCKLTSAEVKKLRVKQRIKQTPHKIRYHKLPKISSNGKVTKEFDYRLDDVVIRISVTYNLHSTEISFRWTKLRP